MITKLKDIVLHDANVNEIILDFINSTISINVSIFNELEKNIKLSSFNLRI